MKYVMIALVCLWIAFDVGRGALTGLANAREEELSAMSLPKMLEVVAGSERRRVGSEWIDHAVLTDIAPHRRHIVYHLRLTRETKDRIDAKWSRGWRSITRQRLITKACDSRLLGLSLARGATVAYDCIDKDGVPAFRVEVRNADC